MKVVKHGKRVSAVAAVLCAYSAGLQLPAEARDANNNRPHGVGRINLDLASTNASVTMSRRLAETVSIQVGDVTQTISAGQIVTPAQAVAAYQVMQGNAQTVLIGAQGNAIGGTVDINPTLQKHVTGMYIPKDVTVVSDVARNGMIRMSGDFTNNGTYYAVSTNRRLDTAQLNASNIINQQGALISSVAPQGGFAGFGELNSNLNLSLNATNDLVNNGTISSSGSLDVVAGGSIINASGGASGAALMQAQNTVNLSAANIVNSAAITAQTGNINIAALNASDVLNKINVQNTGGVLSALEGSINVGTVGESADIGLTGGDWLSKELNLVAGEGEIVASLGKVTGNVNSSARIEHFFADTETLVLGNNCITGDPTFAATGSITIDGLVTAAEALAIIAGGNILATANGTVVNSVGATTYIIAGANVTAGTAGNVTLPGIPAATPVTIQFGGGAGNIDFSACAQGTAFKTNGGDLIILAHSNGTASGNIWMPIGAGAIETDGGNLTIIGGGGGGSTPSQSGQIIPEAIRVSSVITDGISAGADAGNITIKTAQPTITSGPTAVFATDGTTTATFGSGATSANASFQATTAISASGSNGAGGSAGVAGQDGGIGGDISITTGGPLLSGLIQSLGGSGGNGGLPVAFGAGPDGGSAGVGGNISLNSLSSINVSAVRTTGGSGGGGGFADAGSGLSGGDGQDGGKGGDAGLIGTTFLIGSLETGGGDGGTGGDGDLAGGSGGSGGSGGDGGIVSVSATTLNQSIPGVAIVTRGGNGAVGATDASSTGNGGNGGNVILNLVSSLNTANVDASGGAGANGAAPINTGSGTGGTGGDGADVSMTAGTSINTGTIFAFGSNGGFGAIGNNNGGSGGWGGNGGDVSLNATTTLTVGDINAYAGNGGGGASAGGSDTGGAGGKGGNGGLVGLTSGSMLALHDVFASGGDGGFGGNGVGGGGSNGGAGGDGGNAGLLGIDAGDVDTTLSGLLSLGTGFGAGGGSPGGPGTPGAPGVDGMAGSLDAKSKGQLGTTSDPIITTAAKMTLNATGDVVAQANAGTVILTGSNAGKSFLLHTNTSMIVDVGAIPVTSDLTLRAVFGLIALSSSSLSVSAKPGGVGGSINILTNTLIWTNSGIDPLSITTNGTTTGGTASITTGDSITVGTLAGQYNIDAAGSNGGTLNLKSTGGTISIDNVADLKVGPTGANGNGGNLSLSAQDIVYTGPGPFVLDQARGKGIGTIGTGGTISIEILSAIGSLTIGTNNGDYLIDVSGSSGGKVLVATNQNLIVDTNTAALNVQALTVGGAVGSIDFKAADITKFGGGTLLIDLSSDPLINGKAGNISLEQTQVGTTIIGPLGTGDYNLIANSPIQGGNITFRTNGDLTVNPTGFSNLATNKTGGVNGSLTFEAGAGGGSGNLVINGSLSTASKGGTAGSITLISDSNTTFSYGKTGFSGNGFASGTATVSGKVAKGDLSITNFGGELNINSAIASVNTLSLTTGNFGDLILIASVKSTKTVILNSSMNLVADSTVGDKTTQQMTIAGELIVTGTKGGFTAVNLDATSNSSFTGPLGVGPATVSASTLKLYVIGDANIGLESSVLLDDIVVNGNLTLSTKGSINPLIPGVIVQADDSLSLTGSSVGDIQDLQIQTNSLQLSGMKVQSKLHSIGVNPLELQISNFGSPLSIISESGIQVDDTFGSTKAVIDLTAKTGDIIQNGGTIIAKQLTLTTVSGAIGAPTGLGGPLLVNAALLGANAGTFINVEDAASAVGLLDTIANNGSISIATSTTAKSLSVVSLATITALEGAISLQNQNNLKGTIIIGSGSNINTSGALGGDIQIFIGAAPPAVVAGTMPVTGVVENKQGVTGGVFYGTNGITALSKTGINTLNYKNASIIFSTGTLSSKAITLGGNVSMTADPPNPGELIGALTNLPLESTGSVQSVPESGATQSLRTLNRVLTPSNVQLMATTNAPPIVLPSSPANTLMVLGSTNASGNTVLSTDGLSTLNNAGSSSLLTDYGFGKRSNKESLPLHAAAISKYVAVQSQLIGADFEPGEIDAHVVSDRDLGLGSNLTPVNPVDMTHYEATESAPKKIALRNGSVVVSSDSPTIVETAFGSVGVDAKSVVLIMAKASSLAVFNLDDCHRDSVHVNAGKRTFTLSPGRHAVVTWENIDNFGAINPAECITYRGIANSHVENGLRAFTGEFSIPSAINTVKQLRHLVRTKNSVSRQTVDHMMKTTAVLLQLQGMGQYEQFVRPRVAAYSPMTNQ